jgi:hypothetical protein
LLQQNSLEHLSAQDFSATQNQQFFELITQSLSQDELEPAEYIQEQKPEGLDEYLEEAGKHHLSSERKTDSWLDDLFRTVIRIRTQVINQNLRELKYLQEDKNPDANETVVPYQDMVLKYTQQLRGLNVALGSLSRLKS